MTGICHRFVFGAHAVDGGVFCLCFQGDLFLRPRSIFCAVHLIPVAGAAAV